MRRGASLTPCVPVHNRLVTLPSRCFLAPQVYGFGTVASLAGIALIRGARLDDHSSLDALLRTVGRGVWLASGLTLGLCALAAHLLFRAALAWRLFGVIAVGLVAGVVIAHFTEYCTAYEYAPTRSIAAAAEYGPAPVIIKGLGLGMMSVTVPTLAVSATILACSQIAGSYGVVRVLPGRWARVSGSGGGRASCARALLLACACRRPTVAADCASRIRVNNALPRRMRVPCCRAGRHACTTYSLPAPD